MQCTPDLDSTILRIRRQLKGCVARSAGHYCPSQNCGCSSVGRAPPCQGGRREFEPRHPLPSETAFFIGSTTRSAAKFRQAVVTHIDGFIAVFLAIIANFAISFP